MRKFIFTILLTAIYVMADECDDSWRDLTLPIVITFTDSSLWYKRYSFSDGAAYVTEDGYNCRKQKYEKAFLDTNTYMYREKRSDMPQWTFKLYVLQRKQSSYGIGDVFKDEFLHWQDCGMLNLTHEQADSIITPLAYAMNNWFEGKWLNEGYETDLFYVWEVGGGYTRPKEISAWAKQACLSELTALSPEKPQRASITFEKGTVHVPEDQQGNTYFLFDVNGKVIKNGIADKTINLPNKPTILKIGNTKPVLLLF